MTITEAFIVDYGCGNFSSLRTWLKTHQLCSWLIRSKNDFASLSSTSLLILPGVGHFARAMSVLHEREMIDDLQALKGNIPILGICLGAQLMFEGSSEAPGTHGLSWLQGQCTHLPSDQTPRLGWYRSSVLAEGEATTESLPSLNGYFYYNHCYKMPGISSNSFKLHANSDGCLASFVSSHHLVGVQFHPERSQLKGRDFLAELVKSITLL